jgi:hypothetical protein
VTECLRKIAYQPALGRVIFLRQQADIVAEIKQALKQSGCIVLTTEQREIVRKPETTRQKDALSGWQAIDFWLRGIPGYQSISH